MTTLAELAASTAGLPCRTTDPDLWFSTNVVERANAARQCHHCPLLLDCMRYALDADERYGVWGGVDFEARAVGCGSERGYFGHKSRGETVCPLCEAAHEQAVEANRRRLLAEAHRAGGTASGYWMHRRLDEEACARCKRAQARKSQERRDREREAGDRAREAWDARKAAEALQGRETAVQPFALAG